MVVPGGREGVIAVVVVLTLGVQHERHVGGQGAPPRLDVVDRHVLQGQGVLQPVLQLVQSLAGHQPDQGVDPAEGDRGVGGRHHRVDGST